MNTWIWGPPKWRFLHTLSFTPQDVITPRATETAQFLGTLQHVLPCVYCRESYAHFFDQLEQEQGNAADVARRGDLNKWMFDLHEKVNIKLDVQTTESNIKSAGIEIDTQEHPLPLPLCRKRQLTFECLRKRFAVRKLQYSSTDVWDFLLIFMLNLDDVRAKGETLPPARVEGYKTFIRLLPVMVDMSCGALPTATPATNRFCAAIHKLADSYDAALERQKLAPSSSVLFKWVLYHRAAYEEMTSAYTPAYEADMLQRFALVRAGACIDGSCV